MTPTMIDSSISTKSRVPGHHHTFCKSSVSFSRLKNINPSTTIKMTAHNNNPIPTLNFSLSPSEIISLTKQEIESANSFFSQLLSIPIESRNVTNVLLPWAQWEGQFTTNSTSYTFVQQVSPDSAVRDAAVEANKLLDQFAIEQGAREDLYLLAKSVAKEHDEDPEITRFREKLLQEFKHNGLELSPEQREMLKEKRQRLAELAVDFSNTMNSDKTELVLSKGTT